MKVELSRFVRSDLQEIADYIALHNPTRALSFVEELERVIWDTGENPLIHRLRPDIAPGVRVAVYNRYLILFRIQGDVVYVGRVLNGARNLSKVWFPR